MSKVTLSVIKADVGSIGGHTKPWSGRGGQANNPYAIDRNPCGSSSGSGAAASANFAAVSLGTETDGSIVCPASINEIGRASCGKECRDRGGVDGEKQEESMTR